MNVSPKRSVHILPQNGRAIQIWNSTILSGAPSISLSDRNHLVFRTSEDGIWGGARNFIGEMNQVLNLS